MVKEVSVRLLDVMLYCFFFIIYLRIGSIKSIKVCIVPVISNLKICRLCIFKNNKNIFKKIFRLKHETSSFIRSRANSEFCRLD